MKNSKGITLIQPYHDLALMRREQFHGEGDNISKTTCFMWSKTPECYDWWDHVDNGDMPEIPAASLAELEAWRKSREENKQEAMVEDNPEPDYKAMYDELCKRYKALDHNHNRLCQDYDFYKHRTNVIADPTTSRNWIAECSMRLFSTGVSLELSWDKAQKWAAEGKKRGHLPNN